MLKMPEKRRIGLRQYNSDTLVEDTKENRNFNEHHNLWLAYHEQEIKRLKDEGHMKDVQWNNLNAKFNRFVKDWPMGARG